jgi:hypothetical protein
MAERTFRGTPPLDPEQIGAMFGEAGLRLLGISSDPTRRTGTRAFALATKDAAPPVEI